MITYLYWIFVFILAAAALYGIGIKIGKLKAGIIISVIILIIGWASYVFHYQQIFVKRYGGVMTIKVPDGHRHISATWKDDNLWIENYNPKTNTCTFGEYSKGNVLEGRVIIKNCNPLSPSEGMGAGVLPSEKTDTSDK